MSIRVYCVSLLAAVFKGPGSFHSWQTDRRPCQKAT